MPQTACKPKLLWTVESLLERPCRSCNGQGITTFAHRYGKSTIFLYAHWSNPLLILDTLTKVENGKVRVEDFHRGHLSLKTGTILTVVALPGHNTPLPNLTKLTLSPISFESWECLTRINARVVNRPGVLRKLMLALAHANVNILYHASGPLENGRFQRIEFLVDAKKYYNRFSDLKCDRKVKDYHVLSQLEIWLKSLMVEVLDFDDSRMRLKVRPMETFRRTWRAYNLFNREAEYPEPILDYVDIQNGWVELPQKILSDFGDQPCNLMLNSDTKDRLLKGLLFKSYDLVTYLRVTFFHIPGASAEICAALAEYFHFVTSLTRIQEQGRVCSVELMLYSSDLKNPTQETQRRQVIETVLSRHGFKKFNIQVSYPSNLRGVDPRSHKPKSHPESLTNIQKTLNICPEESHLFKKSAINILRERIDNFQLLMVSDESKTSDQFATPITSRFAAEACLELLSRQGEQELSHSRVFVSFPFTFKNLFEEVKVALEKKGMVVITGEEPSGKTAFREIIVDRICSCYGFIGIWKYEERLGPVKFSPWMSWELGIAQSCKMPVRIFPHEEMTHDQFFPHRAILPEFHMPPFTELDFSSYVNRMIVDFIDDVRLFSRSSLHNGPNKYSHTN